MPSKRSQTNRALMKGTNIGLVRENRCKICQSPLRDRIDRLAAAGFGGTAIADEILGVDPNLSRNRDSLRKGISRHVGEHLKVKDAAIRQILENRAKEAGILLENAKGQLVSDQGLLDLMVAQATEQITEPGARVYYKDALEAVKIKKDIEAGRFAQQLEMYERQLWAISQAIKEIVPQEYYPMIVEKAKGLFEEPVLDLPEPKKELNR